MKNNDFKYINFYDYVIKVLSICKIGKLFSKDPYALENYDELEKISMKMLGNFDILTYDKPNIFLKNIYPTPSVSCRCVIFNDEGKILFVKESVDEKYCLPGGWCDLYASPKESILNEISQEAGAVVKDLDFIGVINKTPLKKDYKKLLQNEIIKNFSKKGQAVVDKNILALEKSKKAVKKVNLKTLKILKEDGKTRFSENYNLKPVSEFSKDGSIKTDTTKFEKRGIADNISQWQPSKCIQCGQCVLACPHGALKAVLVKTPPKDVPFVKAFGVDGYYRIQISPEDCTGCGLCQEICPALGKAIIMKPANQILEQEKQNYQITESLKTIKKTPFSKSTVKGLQFEKNYFAFPGACAGCGETPYIKLATMLFGDKMVIANATGCSSIYGGSYPSCPYSVNAQGKGPAWANSLFEDNAEFGLGIKLAKQLRGSSESVWIIGGDGWAYDIGFGGLDHVLASEENVNILVLDNECYANTGGQASKATPAGAAVKLADGGKVTNKKNLAAMALTYGNVYVASVALGADMNQCIKAFREAEAYNGPSLIIAYSTCVNQGFDMSKSLTEMRKAVESGYITLFRYHPTQGFTLDRGEINNKYIPFLLSERRYAYLNETHPDKAKKLFKKSKERVKDNYVSYKKIERTNNKIKG